MIMERQKWEYKVVCRPLHADYSYVENILNQLGNEGWELVAIAPTGGFTLKRPLINISINSEKSNNNVSDKDAIRKQIEMYQ